MVTESDIKQQIRHFQAELAEAEADAKRAINRVESLRQIVSGLKGLSAASEPEVTERLFPAPATSLVRDIPHGGDLTVSPPLNGRDAVRQVLIDTRRAWKIPELAAEIQARGWMPGVASPRDATAASVQRLWKQDQEVERVGHGVYRYRLDKLPPLTEESPSRPDEGGESD
jgi:hypothetical protein